VTRRRAKKVATPSIFFAALLGALAGPARAAPPDARLALELAKPRIERIDAGFTQVESDDERIVHAELLPSGELLLEPKAAGVTRVFLFTDRLVRALEVAAGVPLPPIDPAPLAPCAKPLITAACYPAWRDTLQHLAAQDAPKLELELDGEQEQVKAAQAALAQAGMGQVQLAFSPFGVKLKGAKDAAEEHRALRAIWPWMLGPLRLDR
jgi:hypothetical protein